MKTRYMIIAGMVLMAAPAVAQETYQDTKLVNNQLTGTARYVGMGGAMEALGADLSTIASNPAGVGMFRSSQVAISGGLISQQGETTSPEYIGNGVHFGLNFDGKKNNLSFDQLGFVYSMRNGRNSYLNLAFNYNKSRNFDQILTAAGALNNASQNKLTSLKFPIANDYNWNAIDQNYRSLMIPVNDKENNQVGIEYLNGNGYVFGQYQKGYIGNYNFNISGNLNNRVYLGLTFGLYDVNYRSNSIYSEQLVDNNSATSWEALKIDGSGFDVKLGAIVRPFANSPFRVGMYVHTPIWYDLHMVGNNDLTLANTIQNFKADKGQAAKYNFKIYTPWKFGVSLGHTFGRQLALGATYEYADYSRINNRINNGGYYDNWDGRYYETSVADQNMNANTRQVLKGVSTLKLGLEYKPVSDVALRLGYNYVSPMFNMYGVRDGSISSPGSADATSTDYTNWKATNRFTAGIGYAVNHFFVDLAYQYSHTNGEFYPFMSGNGARLRFAENVPMQDQIGYANVGGQVVRIPQGNISNDVSQTKVSNNRHQLMLTLGYRF